jgi:MFS family permease
MPSRLSGRYGPAVLIALLGLVPDIVLTTAFTPLTEVLTEELHTTRLALQLAEGMSNAGYAVGAVVAAYLGQRFLQRRLFLGYEAACVVGSVLTAAAGSVVPFFAGRLLQGTATGFMLVAALPPLVTRFGAARLRLTVTIVNVGLFGATTVGPLVGGPAAAAGQWRLLFWIVAALGAAGFLVALLGYPALDPPDPGLRLDRPAVLLAVGATFLPFFATSVLMGAGFAAPVFLVPFVLGLAALGALVVLEYRKDDPLMPVKALSTQLPVTGTVVAMIAGAVFVTAVELALLFLDKGAGVSLASAGLAFWPMPLGLVAAALLFGVLLPTRALALLVNAGLVALGAGVGLLLIATGRGHPGPLFGWATLLLGFGAGATVSPGLFLAAFGVPSQALGRAFALVELLRSEAAYAVAPIVAVIAQGAPNLAGGLRLGLLVTLCLAGLGLLVAVLLPALSGARLRAPDLQKWLDGEGKALPSPRTAIHVRPSVEDEEAEPLLPRPLRSE